jgi:hypothetical protein
VARSKRKKRRQEWIFHLHPGVSLLFPLVISIPTLRLLAVVSSRVGVDAKAVPHYVGTPCGGLGKQAKRERPYGWEPAFASGSKDDRQHENNKHEHEKAGRN